MVWRLRPTMGCLQAGELQKPMIWFSPSLKAWELKSWWCKSWSETGCHKQEHRHLRVREDGCPGSSRESKFTLHSSFLIYSGPQQIGQCSSPLVRVIFTQSVDSNTNYLSMTASQTQAEIMFYQLFGHSFALSGWYIKLTITVTIITLVEIDLGKLLYKVLWGEECQNTYYQVRYIANVISY